MQHWHLIAITLAGWAINIFILSYFLDKIEELYHKMKHVEDRLLGAEERMRKANPSVLFQRIKYPGVICDD